MDNISKKYIILRKYKDLVPGNIRYIVKDDGYYIKYKDTRDNLRKNLYIKTPSLKYGFSESSDKYIYLTFYFDESDKSTDSFKNLLRLLDRNHIQHLYEYDESPNKIVSSFERQYINTLNSKWNDLTQNEDSIKIKIDKSGIDRVEVYDQDNNQVHVSMLSNGFKCRILLQHLGVNIYNTTVGNMSFYCPIWDVVQIKTEIPEKIFDSCQFTNDDIAAVPEDNRLIWDIYEDYGLVKPDEEGEVPPPTPPF
jgi:hypothetical protein